METRVFSLLFCFVLAKVNAFIEKITEHGSGQRNHRLVIIIERFPPKGHFTFGEHCQFYVD